MWGFGRNSIYIAGIVAVTAAIGACSTEPFENLTNVNLLPKIDQIARPDWLTYSGGKGEFELRPVGPDDLVSPEGHCAPTPEQVAGAVAQPAARPDAGAGAPQEFSPEETAARPSPSLLQGGIALQMTECDVVRRAGTPEKVEFGTNERGERTVVLTYTRGDRPGIYRFAAGRLYSIERAPEPPHPKKPNRSKRAKRPARA